MTKDDWRDETQAQLDSSAIFQELKKKCDADSSGTHVLSLVDDATSYAYQKTKTIIMHMGEFTLHDGDHLFRVLKLMERLLTAGQIQKLTVPELMLLILSAFFHDIGMAPNEKDVLAWKKVWDDSPLFEDEEDEDQFNKFQRYCSARPDQSAKIDTLISQGKNSEADLIKYYMISEYIRVSHATRAKEIVKQDWLGKIKYRDTDLTVEFAEICFSHNEDALSILELDRNFLCGSEVYANLQLVAVILRLADILDFDAKRTPSILFSHLFVRHPISIAEWNKHRAVEAWSINSDRIQFHAKCNHPAIEASIHAFCDLIDNELSACNNIISSINEFNRNNKNDLVISIPLKVDRSKIETRKDIDGNPEYLYRETQFNLSKNQVIDLLMGTKLYGDPEAALRELLQNSIDACLLRDALEKSWNNPYTPKIHVKYSTVDGEDILEVIDNGTGMDQHVIDKYYSKIGSSFYKSAEFYDLKSQSHAQFMPTSRFGIGILSCFMVADTLVVDTRKVEGAHKSSDPINLTVEGQDSIFWIKAGEREKPGTSTKLFLRKQKNPWLRMNEDEFIKSVDTVIPNPPFQIKIETESHEKIKDQDSFNEVKAESLKTHYWKDHENIKTINITFTDHKLGFVGSAIIGILESYGKPTLSIEMTPKSIEIDGDSYILGKSITMGSTEINMNTTSISIDEDGSINSSEGYSTLAKSDSRLSLHGIEVPTTLFPESWQMKANQVRLQWPLPMLIIIDICGDRDLDLNSSRTQILMSDKWTSLEEQLSSAICSGIASSVSEEYWNEIVEALTNNSENKIFLESLNNIVWEDENIFA